jgi:hypothetical protein
MLPSASSQDCAPKKITTRVAAGCVAADDDDNVDDDEWDIVEGGWCHAWTTPPSAVVMVTRRAAHDTPVSSPARAYSALLFLSTSASSASHLSPAVASTSFASAAAAAASHSRDKCDSNGVGGDNADHDNGSDDDEDDGESKCSSTDSGGCTLSTYRVTTYSCSDRDPKRAIGAASSVIITVTSAASASVLHATYVIWSYLVTDSRETHDTYIKVCTGGAQSMAVFLRFSSAVRMNVLYIYIYDQWPRRSDHRLVVRLMNNHRVDTVLRRALDE